MLVGDRCVVFAERRYGYLFSAVCRSISESCPLHFQGEEARS